MTLDPVGDESLWGSPLFLFSGNSVMKKDNDLLPSDFSCKISILPTSQPFHVFDILCFSTVCVLNYIFLYHTCMNTRTAFLFFLWQVDMLKALSSFVFQWSRIISFRFYMCINRGGLYLKTWHIYVCVCVSLCLHAGMRGWKGVEWILRAGRCIIAAGSP